MSETEKKKKRKKRTRKKEKPPYLLLGSGVFVLLVCVYMFLSPISVVNKFLFNPSKVTAYPDIPGELLGAKREDVNFQTPFGVNLNGIYFEKPGAKYVAILHHGQDGNIGEHMGLVKTILMNGQSVLTYDYEGFGISSGSPSIAGIIEDGQSAVDFLVRTKKFKPNQIIQYGASMGSGVAAQVALTKGAAAVILIAPYTSLKKLAKETYPYLNLYPDFFFPADVGVYEFFTKNLVVPVLCIHGEDDQRISVSHTKLLEQTFGKRVTSYVIVPGKHHSDLGVEFLAKEIGIFLKDSLGVTDTYGDKSEIENKETEKEAVPALP